MSDGGKRPSTSSSGLHLFAGLTSGFASSVLLQPADLLKTRIQQEQQRLHEASRSNASTSSLKAPSQSTILRTLRTVIAQPHPVRSLWRGTLPSTIRTSVGSALYFAGLNRLREGLLRVDSFTVPVSGALREGERSVALATISNASTQPSAAGGEHTALTEKRKLTYFAHLLSGALARASVGIILMPVTVLKVRFESSLYASYGSLFSAAQSIARTEGLRGFFAGTGATMVRDAPYAGIYVCFYEWAKTVVSSSSSVFSGSSSAIDSVENRDGKPLNPAITSFVSGALAASAATAFTTPPDAVKTRLQLRPQEYGNMWTTAKKMVADEGWKSLFDGLTLRMARKAMSSAIAWTVYEEIVRKGNAR